MVKICHEFVKEEKLNVLPSLQITKNVVLKIEYFSLKKAFFSLQKAIFSFVLSNRLFSTIIRYGQIIKFELNQACLRHLEIKNVVKNALP